MNRFPTIEQLKTSKVAELNPHLFGNVTDMVLTNKKSKFGNRKIEIDGYVFDSLKESRRYLELKRMEIYVMISELKVHPVFELSVCRYEADFSYRQNGIFIVEDVKSKITRKLSTYRLKKKMMLQELNIQIKEV